MVKSDTASDKERLRVLFERVLLGEVAQAILRSGMPLKDVADRMEVSEDELWLTLTGETQESINISWLHSVTEALGFYLRIDVIPPNPQKSEMKIAQ